MVSNQSSNYILLNGYARLSTLHVALSSHSVTVEECKSKKKGEVNNNLEAQNEKDLKSKVQDEKDLMDESDKEIKDMLQSDVSMGDAELCTQ